MTASAPMSWPESLRPTLVERDLVLLRRARQTLMGNIAPSKPAPRWSPLRGIRPSSCEPGYPGVWNWDAAFHAIGVMRWDPPLAREQFRILLDAQQPSGALPDVLFTDGRVVADFGKPPVMPWAVAVVDRCAPDDTFLAKAYERFVPYEEFWRRDRGGDAEGLFHYDSAAADPKRRSADAKLESGWDNSVRWDESCRDLWPIDLNCYMILLYRAMARMAGRLGRRNDIAQWNLRENRLADLVNSRLYDDSRGCYADSRRDDGAPAGPITPASLMPLYVRIAPAQRAKQAEGLARDPRKLFPAMPTVAYDHPEYRGDGYWRGPTWLNTAYFALKGLKFYGFHETADAGRELLLGWCHRNGDALYEYYDSRTGKGIGVGNFGWTAAFVIEFILNWQLCAGEGPE